MSPDAQSTQIPAGAELGIGPPRIPPYGPFIAALRGALGSATAVVVSMTVGDEEPTDVIGLLPPVGSRVQGDGDAPHASVVAASIAGHVPAGANLSVAKLALSLAVAAMHIGPPVSGSAIELLLAEAARTEAGAERMWRRLGELRVWVPVDDAPGIELRPALGGALMVAELAADAPVPPLPLHDRDGQAAVHAFSGVWQLVHADPPHGAAIRTTLDRVAEAMPIDAALGLDVGCLHATLLTPPSGTPAPRSG